jgi:glycogen(starch) synthase
MRILFLSNFYPPFTRGGYEQWCQEVASELSKRGHDVRVLTSRSPDGNNLWIGDEIPIHRLLHLEVEGGLIQTTIRLLKDRKRFEQENLDSTQRLIKDFQPDVAFVWGMWNVPRSVPAMVEQLLRGRVAYYICDYWLSLRSSYIQRWQEPSNRMLTRVPKQLLGRHFLHQLEKENRPRLELEHPICVSRAVQKLLVESGVPIHHAQVIHGGTQVDDFSAVASRNKKRENNIPLRLLYAGRLSAEKGVHTAIHALGLIVNRYDSDITLDIVGEGDPSYFDALKSNVQRNNLNRNIRFFGSVDRSEIPAVLTRYDSLIFPSEWEEPFARIVLEAMASGLVVIGTTTGGTTEILIEGETGLTFPPGDVHALASQIERLYSNAEFGSLLAETGQQLVWDKFTFTRMVDQLESALKSICANSN